jgi:ABC-type phosphate transport system permease subunit
MTWTQPKAMELFIRTGYDLQKSSSHTSQSWKEKGVSIEVTWSLWFITTLILAAFILGTVFGVFLATNLVCGSDGRPRYR